MASGNFERCLREVLRHEGGWVNDAQDPGGETNYGITKRTARAHGYHGHMKSISMSIVEQIYRSGYWDALKADDLPIGLDLAVFDFAVNSGPSRARSFLLTIDRGDTAVAIRQLCQKRLSWLRDLRTFKRFGKGWTRRIESVQAEALKMAATSSITAPLDSPKPDQKQEQPAAKPAGFWASREG
jgi:lysozyme family protein